MSGQLTGVYPGRVVSAADPKKHGRARLQVPQVSGQAVTDWAPTAQPGLGAPRVGVRVWVMYQNGDPSYPVYLPPTPAPAQRPQNTVQLALPDYTVPLGNWVDFSASQFPPMTYLVPLSGALYVTVSGRLRQINTTTAYAALGWRMTNSYYSGSSGDDRCLVTVNSPRMQASRRALVTGLPPDKDITIIPQWRISSYSAGNTEISLGEILVEPVPA